MSSAVNKSQKKFMPNIASRGPGGRAPSKRMSKLRASFSVPSSVPSAGSSSDSASTVASIRSQLHEESAENADESVIEEIPAPKRVRIVEPEKETLSQPSKLPQSVPQRVPLPSLNTSRVLPKPSMARHRPVLTPPSSLSKEPRFADSSASAASLTPASAVVSKSVQQEEKPKAPEGYEYIWPEDLPQRRIDERRRRVAVEKEFVEVMRGLFTTKEKQRLQDEGVDEKVAQDMAESAAEQATYHQLKQSVGVEAKQMREKNASNEPSKTLLDVNKFTMASLCKDIPVGDRNDSYDDFELARVNRRRDTVRVFRAKMWSRRMYEPKDNERPALKEAFQRYQRERKERGGKLKTEQEQKFTEIDSQTETEASAHPQASIEIQANGSISLVGTQFDRHKNNRTQREGGTSGPKTEVDPTEQVINSYSYSTRERPDRWTAGETAKFYEAVSALGTDFNLIAHLFPMRSRNQIKTKFKYEERRNPAKLQIHLVSRRKFSVDSYSKVSNVAIQDVSSIEGELENVRKEHEEQMKVEEESRQVARAEDQKSRNQPHTKRERRN